MLLRLSQLSLPYLLGLGILSASAFCVTHAATSGMPDLDRESRMVAEIEDSILDGESVFLPSGNASHQFMAIDMVPDDKPRGAVILLHGRGYHANWPDVIQPLRVGLAEQGWRTLSLQMPVLEKAAKYYDYVPLFTHAQPRIEAAITYLKQQGIHNIVLFSHSCGVHMAMDWVRDQGDQSLAAYIGAGMGATDYQQKMAEPFPLADMRVPVLDIYGSQEFKGVLRMAPERLAAIKKANHPKSRQQVIDGANHYFNTEEQSEALLTSVTSWLDSLGLVEGDK